MKMKSQIINAANQMSEENNRISVTHESTRSPEPQEKKGNANRVYVREGEERINFVRDDGQPMSIVREDGVTKLFTAGSWKPYCGDVLEIIVE